MNVDWRESTWKQYGAAIDMLADAIRLCPDHLWAVALWDDPEDARYGQFWFLAYHALKWLDLYLTGTSEGFAPPAPFIAGALPAEPYTREQVLAYLASCREKCRATLAGMTDERAQDRCVFNWMQPTFLELQIYSMRHVQEHASQLNLVLGQHGVTGQDWVAAARSNDP